MPKLKQDDKGAEVERIIAKRLGLDPSQIIAGSILCENDGGRETVRWSGLSVVEPGFLQSVFDEVYPA